MEPGEVRIGLVRNFTTHYIYTHRNYHITMTLKKGRMGEIIEINPKHNAPISTISGMGLYRQGGNTNLGAIIASMQFRQGDNLQNGTPMTLSIPQHSSSNCIVFNEVDLIFAGGKIDSQSCTVAISGHDLKTVDITAGKTSGTIYYKIATDQSAIPDTPYTNELRYTLKEIPY